MNSNTNSRQSTNTRIYYFDAIKTLAIFLVIFVHYPMISDSIPSNLSMLLTYVAAPLFFMVNGALLLRKPIDVKKHYKKVIHLILVTILWKIIYIVGSLLVGRIFSNDLTPLNIITTLTSNNNIKSVPTEHLWFMYSLIGVYIILPFIQTFIGNNKKRYNIILAMSLLLSFGASFLGDISLLLSRLFATPTFNFSSMVAAFIPVSSLNIIALMLTGNKLHNFLKDSKNKKNIFSRPIHTIIASILLYLLGFFIFSICLYAREGKYMTGGYAGIPGAYSELGILLMSISVFIGANVLFKKKNCLLTLVGRRTMNIYLIHMFICVLFNQYLRSNLHHLHPGAPANLIRTIIVFAISFGITELLRQSKMLKKLLGLA